MSGKLKRRAIYNPAAATKEPAATVHDRKSTDITIGAEGHVAKMVIDDPLGLNPGDKIEVLRHLRADPIAQMHARKHIDDAQYEAGRSFQRDWEKAERGPRAIDPFKEYVDGGLAAEPVTDGQLAAVDRLNRAEAQVRADHGAKGVAIVHEVLVHGLSMGQVARRRGLDGDRWRDFFGKLFRECLETLAVAYGHSNLAKVVSDVSSGT
jgi:hypothetical protein